MKKRNHFITIFFFISMFLDISDPKKENNSILINKLAFAQEFNQLQNNITSSKNTNKNNTKNLSTSNIITFATNIAERADKIPNISFMDETNIQYFIKDFSGQVVILYLWATWCLDCVEELVQLNKLREKFIYNDVLDIEIIPLSIDFKDIKRLEFLYRDRNIDKLGLFVDKNKSIMKTFSVNFVPATIIIDKQLRKRVHINHHIAWDSNETYDSLITLR